MKQMLRAQAVSHAKPQKSVPQAIVMQQKTAAGVVYTVSYPAPKKRKGYQPNAASQFAAPEVTLSMLSGAGGR